MSCRGTQLTIYRRPGVDGGEAGAERAKDRVELTALLGLEEADEVTLEPRDVDVQGAVEDVAAFRREDGQGRAAIGGIGLAADQAGALHTVGELGEAAGAEQDHLGQVGHPDGVAGRAADPEEHLEPGTGDVERLVQLAVEAAPHRLVDLQEEAPEGDALVVEEGVAPGVVAHGTYDTRPLQRSIFLDKYRRQCYITFRGR